MVFLAHYRQTGESLFYTSLTTYPLVITSPTAHKSLVHSNNCSTCPKSYESYLEMIKHDKTVSDSTTPTELESHLTECPTTSLPASSPLRKCRQRDCIEDELSHKYVYIFFSTDDNG